MNGVLNLGWWATFGGVKLLWVFVVCTSLVTLWHCDCGGGKMKWVVKKMVGNEGEAGRLIEIFDELLRYWSHIK